MTTIENLEKQKQLLQETPNTQNNNLDNQVLINKFKYFNFILYYILILV